MNERTKHLLPHTEIRARTAEKRAVLLRFLRDELYTDATVAGLLLRLGTRQAIHKTFLTLERDELIRRETVTTPAGRRVTLWGITAHGQALAFDPETETTERRYFEPSRVGLTVLDHTLDLQRLRLQAMRAGWTDWRLGDRVKWIKGHSRPDALTVAPDGQHWAVELERTMKTVKRYESILADRLQQIKRQVVSKVVWVSPTAEQSQRLEKIIKSIEYVIVQGEKIRLDPAKHHTNILFTHYSNFPPTEGA